MKAKPQPCRVKLELGLSLHKEGAISELYKFFLDIFNEQETSVTEVVGGEGRKVQ